MLLMILWVLWTQMSAPQVMAEGGRSGWNFRCGPWASSTSSIAPALWVSRAISRRLVPYSLVGRVGHQHGLGVRMLLESARPTLRA